MKTECKPRIRIHEWRDFFCFGNNKYANKLKTPASTGSVKAYRMQAPDPDPRVAKYFLFSLDFENKYTMEIRNSYRYR
jgi:hypothetical protein